MSKERPCEMCGEEHPVEALIEFGDIPMCEPCLESSTVICQHCGTRIWNDDNAGDEDTPLCQHCYDRYYISCDECGRVILESQAYYDNGPLCSCCSRDSKVIHDYYHKPEPIFYGEDSRYFGVELEIDDAGESDRKAAEILDVANGNGLEHLYCKHDGSLDDGFELVTHPMTLDYHTEEMPWRGILAKAKELGYLSHQARTCGLHIHVNRTAFGANTTKQDACIARILYFFEKHWEELLKFSRRTQRQLERWAARYGYKEHPMEILDKAKSAYGDCRYTCVNLTNATTVEFRIFRGTLKLNTLIATLQLVDRICDAAINLSDEEIKELSWTTFVAGCLQPELVQYLKERQLYINEPVETEVEI